MNFLKIVIAAALINSAITTTANAQIKNETQSEGLKFFGSKSFAELQAYDKAHPGRTKNAFEEAETEEDESEDTYELNKRVAGIRTTEQSRSIGAPRVNNLRKPGAPVQYALNACVNFEALPTNFNSYPPDVHGAVGFDHLVTTLNTEVRIQSKTSALVSTVTLSSFWSSTGETDVFDPRIVYDQLSNRWITMACVARRSASSGFVLAASQTPDPTGAWNFYKVDADPADTLWFDYGSMGFSNDKICIAGNMFNNNDKKNGDGGRLFTISKSNVLNGLSLGSVTRTRGVAFTTVPVLTFDNISTCYAVAVWNGEVAQLKLYSVTGSAGAATLTDNGIVDYGSNNGWKGGLGNVLPQSGSAIKINSGDERMQSAVYRGQKIWWANNFYWPLAAPAYCGIQYGIFNVVTRSTIDFAGIWNDTGAEMFCFPNIAVNVHEDIGVAFSYFSTSGFPSAGVAHGSGALGNTSYNIMKAGETYYNYGFPNDSTIRYRWGDYMSVSIDPTDDVSMWSISQYARLPNHNNWGTWWAKLCPVSCLTNSTESFTALAGSVKKVEVTNNINSTSVVSSGAYLKYDAGNAVIMQPGFRAVAGSTYRAFIEGCGGYE